MTTNPHVIVRFQRETGDVELDPYREYRVSVDGGPYSGVFRSPWTQAQLEEAIARLRNTTDDRPDMQSIKELGQKLGQAIYQISGLSTLLRPGTTVWWQLDHPELTRIPWELATRDQPPYHHLLLEGISFVRRIPAAVFDPPAVWPTGKNESLRLLYAWSEQPGSEVPHQAHQEQLEGICSDYGVDMVVARAVPDVRTLRDLCIAKRFHFVHLLAHGGRTDGAWGLKLANYTANSEQIARALRAGETTPALVTVSACDSANEPNNSFSSIAYQLHVYGIPLVLASQFRLRKTVSVASVAHVYEKLLGGGDPLGILAALRRQVSVEDNEAWTNEVLYCRYRPESLQEFNALAQQQAALRRARSIERQLQGRDLAANDDQTRADKRTAIDALRKESEKLRTLVGTLGKDVRQNRERLAETYGLLGSLHRRIAELQATPPNPEDLRAARDYYEKGLRSDWNSHYCGINVIHLSLRLGERARAEELIPRVRDAAEGDAKSNVDFWAYATLGDLEAYAGRKEEAAERYREFVRAVEADTPDLTLRADNLRSCRRPLEENRRIFVGDEFRCLQSAIDASIPIFDSAIARNS